MRHLRILGLTALVVSIWAMPIALAVARDRMFELPGSVGWSLFWCFLSLLLVSAIVLRSRTIIGAMAGAVAGIYLMGLLPHVEGPIVCAIVGSLAGFALEVTMVEKPADRPILVWRPSTPEMRNGDMAHLLTLHPAVAVYFWANWSLDLSMDRGIAAIAGKFDGRVAFFCCNADLPENQELCRECGVTNIPALAVLSLGEPSRILIGFRDPQQLASEIESLLK